jgi:hypothetical protein
MNSKSAAEAIPCSSGVLRGSPAVSAPTAKSLAEKQNNKAANLAQFMTKIPQRERTNALIPESQILTPGRRWSPAPDSLFDTVHLMEAGNRA